VNKAHRDLDRREASIAQREVTFNIQEEHTKELNSRAEAMLKKAEEERATAGADLKAAEETLKTAAQEKAQAEKNLATVAQANYRAKRGGLIAQQAEAKRLNAQGKLSDLQKRYARQETDLTRLRTKLSDTEQERDRFEQRALRAEERASRRIITTYHPRKRYYGNHHIGGSHHGHSNRDERNPEGIPNNTPHKPTPKKKLGVHFKASR